MLVTMSAFPGSGRSGFAKTTNFGQDLEAAGEVIYWAHLLEFFLNALLM